ncbi:MAG: PEP/pyruvate-binding domain-containing protein [Candidatus Paceibacterota bacterium]
MNYIKFFKDLNKNDAEIAGGKGASLGEMTKANIPVPPGFVVLSDAFEFFIRETDLISEIEASLAKVNHKEMESIENASETIQELIHKAKMPEVLEKEITDSFKKLDTEFVAVRSSATAEDGAENAWAGQLDSFLNTKEENILENVQKCFASLFTPRAIFYRFEKGLHNTHISVAVVIQKMVNSEKSGIAFSVHPVTEDRNQMIIEASWGLGEAIVSGQITPDSYVVEKEPRNILDVNIAEKDRGLFRLAFGGNEWKDLPSKKANEQCLSGKEILEFSELILKIENHYGFPCDIEWAFEDGEFYITQSRPITTLK